MSEPTEQPEAAKPRPRIRGLAIRSLPTFPNAMQWVCGLAAVAGVYLQWGPNVTLIVGGVAGVVLAALKEGGKL